MKSLSISEKHNLEKYIINQGSYSLISRDVEQLERICGELDKSIAQVAINWLPQNKQVSNVVNGARDEKQLISNIEAVGWNLTEKHLNQLNEVSKQPLIYTHWVGKR